MSISNLLKMKCKVYRNPILNSPNGMDAFANMAEPVWDLIVENEKCNIQSYGLRSSNREMTLSGPLDTGLYFGFFLTPKELGDRVEVTLPENILPILYIRSEDPSIRAITGKVHHYEYALGIEIP